jgi:hypothetical protein
MHEIGGKIFDIIVLVCNLFCHLKVTDVNDAAPLKSCPATLYECRTTQIVFVYSHRINGVSLLLYAVLEVDSMCRGVGEANKHCLGALLGYDILLDRAGGQHPCLADSDVATGVRLPARFVPPIGGVNKSADNHAISHAEHDAEFCVARK